MDKAFGLLLSARKRKWRPSRGNCARIATSQRRAERKGRGRGFDHNRYTNAYFKAAGLISLLEITQTGLPVSRKDTLLASTH